MKEYSQPPLPVSAPVSSLSSGLRGGWIVTVVFVVVFAVDVVLVVAVIVDVDVVVDVIVDVDVVVVV